MDSSRLPNLGFFWVFLEAMIAVEWRERGGRRLSRKSGLIRCRRPARETDSADVATPEKGI